MPSTFDHRRVGGVGDLDSTPPDVADDGTTGTIEDSPTVCGEQPAAFSADDRRCVVVLRYEVISRVIHHVSLTSLLRQVVAEHDRQARAGCGDLRHAMLEIVLAGTTHHEQINNDLLAFLKSV